MTDLTTAPGQASADSIEPIEQWFAQLPAPSPDAGAKGFPFAPATMLAPMEGVTHAIFRDQMAARGHLGVVCTEFIRIASGKGSASKRRKLVEQNVDLCPDAPLSVQIMGNDLERLAEAAQVAEEAGAAVVDLNLGCPSRNASKSGVGAAMLKDPKLLFDIIQMLRESTSGLLSAKIRAGFDQSNHVVGLARTVQAAGVDFVTVHPRCRQDFYRGVADWRTIKLLKDSLQIPVVGNGDCWYAADALRMRAETGCDAVMLGRPALRNPWIFEQIADLSAGRQPRNPSALDLREYLHGIVSSYRRVFSENRALGRIKELIQYVGRAVDDGRAFRKAGLRASDLDDFLRVVDAHLVANQAVDLDAQGSRQLEASGSALVSPETLISPNEDLNAKVSWGN